jgi:hypothetical protein
MIAADEIKAHLENLGLPEAARQWLNDLWHVTQVFDDAMDGNAVAKGDASRAVWATFVTMPLNDFYGRNASVLQPVLALQVLKWEAANEAEADGQRDERSYMWRAGFYDVVLMVCHLCGIKGGRKVMEMYGETFREYQEGA